MRMPDASSSPDSWSSPTQAETKALSSSINEDMADLLGVDFSDTSPTPAFPLFPSPHNGTTTSPPNTAGPWYDWLPMTPDVAVKVASPKIVLAPEGDEEEEEGEIKEEARLDVEELKEEPITTAEDEEESSPGSAPSKESSIARTPPKSVASDTSPPLSAVATPFKSQVVRVTPGSAPHSFFPHRATSHIGTSLPSTPHFSRQPEADLVDGANVSSPPHPAPAAIVETPSDAQDAELGEEADNPTSNRTQVPTNIPHNVPLPDSQPSSTKERSSRLSIVNPSQLTENGETMVRRSTPLSALVRSMSQFSLTEKGDDTIPNGDSGQAEDVQWEKGADPLSGGTADRSPTRVLEDIRLYDGMYTEQGEINQTGLMDSLQEIGELEKYWADYRGACADFAGGMDEVIARISHNLTGHCCAATDYAEDLRLAHQEVIQLQHKIRDLQDGKLAKSQNGHHVPHQVNLLNQQLDDSQKECKRLEATAQRATLREDLWRSKYEKSESDYAKLTEDRAHWHQREMNLGRSWLELEEQLRLVTNEMSRLKKGMAVEETKHSAIQPSVARFGAVLIEFTATVVDEAYIKRGAAGGKELGENILVSLMPQGEGLVIAQVFLNFPDLKKKLSLSYTIKKEADLHDFLDGFRSVSGLFTVVDTESPAGKMEDHLKLYKVLGASKIILVSRRPQPYREVIDTLSDRKEIYAVRDGESQDPFHFLGEDRLVSIDGLLKPSDTRERTSRAIPTPIRTVSPPKRQPPTAPSVAAAEADKHVPPHLRSVPSISSERSEGWQEPFSPSNRSHHNYIPPTPSSDIGPAPWAAPAVKSGSTVQRQTRVLSTPATGRLGTPSTPWWQRGDTMNDQAQSISSRRDSVSSATNSERSLPGTPRASAHDDITPTRPPPELVPDRPLVTRGPPTKVPGLTIPVKDLGSVAGSPPDSDEDNPNVDLPHSAVKWVQRPIEFSQTPSYTPSQGPRTRSNSISSSSVTGPSGYAVRALAQQGIPIQRGHGQFRAPSMTGTNSTPLGQSKGGKVHGFNVHGRK